MKQEVYIVELIDKSKHLTKDGLIKIVNLKASLNKGLSNKLKIFFFPKVTIKRSKIDSPIIIDYNWVAGFFTGEDCFSVSIYKPTYNKSNFYYRFKDIYNKIIPLFNEYNIQGIKALNFQVKNSFNINRIRKNS